MTNKQKYNEENYVNDLEAQALLHTYICVKVNNIKMCHYC